MNNNPLLSWQALLLKFMFFGLVSVILQPPVGSIAGRLSLEQKGFGLQSYDIKGNKVYVTATGPRGSVMDEKGVWVNQDGSFHLDHLPKGEYTLKFHASGYSTEYQNGVFVDDGHVSELAKTIDLSILHPSCQIASNRRVFTSKEPPYFWVNCSGAKDLTVRLYRTDIFKLKRSTTVSGTTVHLSQSGTDEQEDSSALNFGHNLEIYKGTEANEPKIFSQQKPIQVLTRHLNSGDDDWANAQFKLTDPLTYGDYVGLVEAKSATGEVDWNIFWFNVSDLGLIVKQDPEQFLVRAIDLPSGQPIANVPIHFVDDKGKTVYPVKPGSTTTGTDGFTSIKLNSAISDSEVIAVACYGESHAYGSVYSNQDSQRSDSYKSYFYTERPIYRLGQTVYYKGMTRLLGGDGLKNPRGNLTISALIEDPDNNKAWEGSYRTDAHGCWTSLFKIPEDGRTGGYQLTLTYPDGSKDYASFEVAEYRKPEYQVTVTPLQPRYVAGSKIKASIKASYYFGAPVANARVKYTVYAADDYSYRCRLIPRPSYYSYFDDWSDDDDIYPRLSSNGGDYVTEGTTQTDAFGIATVEIETKKMGLPQNGPFEADYLDKSYTIEAEVTDLSRMSVVGSGNCALTAGNFALFVQPENYVAVAGKPVAVSVSTIDYDGKPVTNQSVTLKLSRWVWDQKKSSYVGTESAGQTQVVTNSQGTATFSFDTKTSLPTDTYTVAATASDAQTDIIYDQANLWIASENYPYIRQGDDAKKEGLSVKLDKVAYKPGDVAKAIITAPVNGTEGAQAIVAIEGTKLHKYWTVPMNATAKMVTIPIEASYTPNVYVTVTFVGPDHQFYNQSCPIKVTPQEHFLTLSITTDKEKYSPGETAKYTIAVKDAGGHPAANTELSLGLVDESIYSIRSETAPNIQKFFYGRRDNWVNTNCTFGEEYSGGPDKVEPQVRKDFRDTAAWLPNLTTDANGVAIASIKLPDNLTTWRATVRGITMGNDVGAAINKIISTKDFIVRLALPRFYTEGDQTSVSAVVHNYTAKPQSVNLSISLPGQFEVSEKTQQKITVQPDKPMRFSWPVKVAASGQGIIAAKATSETTGDAMESPIRILPLGVPAFSIASGLMVDDQVSVTIPLTLSPVASRPGVQSFTSNPFPVTPEASPGTLKYNLGLAASSIGPVLGSFDNLIQYPYGCTEQTVSRLMPSVVAMALHKNLNIPISQARSKNFERVYKLSMNKLNDYQHDNGGWGWWQADESNPYLTSLVLEGFWQLKQVGYKVDAQRIRTALNWMNKASKDLHAQLSNPKHKADLYQDRAAITDLAKLSYTLSLYGQKSDKAVLSWLTTHQNVLSPEAACYLTLALKASGNEKWHIIYKHLLILANRHDDFIDWDHTKELLSRMGCNNWLYDYDYRFTGVETTALALRTIVAVDPADRQTIESVKRWILLQHDKNGWINTKTTAQVFLALLEEQLAFNAMSSGSTNLVVDLADKQLSSLIFDHENFYAPESTIATPPLALPESITLKKSGPGRIYYNSLLTYTQRLHPGDKVASSCTPKELVLTRSFCRLVPSAITSDGKIHFRSEKIANNIVSAGETILMKIRVDSPIALPYVILEAYLPSGGEVVDDQSKADLINNDSNDNILGDWAPRWWTHQDVQDDRIVFFVTQLPAGKSEFSTLVRMEMPGTFQINPLSMEGMYAKNVRGYSTLESLKVSESQ